MKRICGRQPVQLHRILDEGQGLAPLHQLRHRVQGPTEVDNAGLCGTVVQHQRHKGCQGREIDPSLPAEGPNAAHRSLV